MVLGEMLIDSFFSLLFGLCLNLARVDDELVLHDNRHVPNSQFGFIRLN